MRFSFLRLAESVAKNAKSYVVDNICGELDTPTKRLFAVIYVQRQQFKVSQDDIIHIEHNFPADVGDRIKLDKVLMVGGENFSVIGRPLLNPSFAIVHCTVIEKNYTQPNVQYNCLTNDAANVRWGSHELTVLRINKIALDKEVFTAPPPDISRQSTSSTTASTIQQT